MKATTQVIVRVAFVAMLIVGTACNKMDRSLISEATVSSPEALAVSEARVRELNARVLQLEGQMQALNKQNAALSDIPGGANWD
ncbi:MAG: hypothetical protein A2051_09470 [Desulfovibrionales bacterium GWA2_65_9]|nr:MAG: hypothetical protein A2051_09470 [Desulfovibrionales bacterium GWA2_65_9]